MGFWDHWHVPAPDHIPGTFGGLSALSWSPPTPTLPKLHFFSSWCGRGLLVGTLNLVTNRWSPTQTTFKGGRWRRCDSLFWDSHNQSLGKKGKELALGTNVTRDLKIRALHLSPLLYSLSWGAGMGVGCATTQQLVAPGWCLLRDMPPGREKRCFPPTPTWKISDWCSLGSCDYWLDQPLWPAGLAIMIGSFLGISYCRGNGTVPRKSILGRTHKIPAAIPTTRQTNLRSGHHRGDRGMAGGSRALSSFENDLGTLVTLSCGFLLMSGFTPSLERFSCLCLWKSLPVSFVT